MEIDPTKLLFIAVAALVLLGPERLPELARRAGELWSQLKGHRDRLTQQIGSIPGLPSAAVSGLLSDSFDPTRQLRGVIEQVRGPFDAPRAAQATSVAGSALDGSRRLDEAGASPGAPLPEEGRRRESWLPSGFAAGSPDLN